MESHAELLVVAKMLLQTCAWLSEFVCSHQDQGYLTVLARDAWLNVEVDKLAKTKVALLHSVPNYFKLLGNPWGCYAGKTCIVKQFDTTLCTWINDQEIKAYWAK